MWARQFWHNAEMIKVIGLLSIVFASSIAFAKSECFELLINHPLATNSSDSPAAAHWMEILGAELDLPEHPAWSNENILQHWSAWRSVTKQQREQALALELLKISPHQAAAAPIITFAGTNLKELSAANLTRMVKQFESNYVIPDAVANDAGLRQSINKLLAKLDFNYTRPVNPIQYRNSPLGYDPPIPSHRELKALDLDNAPSFYSRLVETSPSAGFDMLVTLRERGGSRAPIANLLRQETFVLERKFTLANGFTLPSFSSSKDLFDFFAFWDPQAIAETYRINRFNLPKTVTTVEEFMVYLEINALDTFTAEDAYYRLAPLRSRLGQYALTTADAEQLVKRCLRHYILWRASENPAGVEKIFANLSSSGAIKRFTQIALWPTMHLPSGLSLRIPVVASVENYQLSRIENQATLYPPRWNMQSQRPYSDSSRIDHESQR